MNEQIKEALKKFARDVAVAFVGLVLALAAVFGIVFPSQSTEELVAGVTNQKITAKRAADTMTFASGAQLKANAGSRVVFAGDVQPTVIRVNSTHVFWATPQPSATALPFIIRGGTAATYTSGAAITHGFAAAATWCSIFPQRDVTETITI